PEGCHCFHASPPYRQLRRVLPGTTSADGDLPQSVIMAARPGGSQGYFDKCSLSCHLQFGFTLLRLLIKPRPASKLPDKRPVSFWHTLARVALARAWAPMRAPLGFYSWVNTGRNFSASLRPSRPRSSSCSPWSPKICPRRLKPS